MDSGIFNKLSKRIDSYRGEMIEMQKRLISLPSIAPDSGGKGEYKRARYLEPILKGLFDTITPCHAKDKRAEGGIRPNYACVMKGKDRSRTVWIMAHMDVVGEGDRKSWKTDPFKAVVKNGKIYGRGSEDNNQAIVSGIFSIKALKDENIMPPCNVGLLLVSDEEMTGAYGAPYVLKKYGKLFDRNDIFIVPDHGSPDGSTVEIAEKASLWLKLTFHGKQAHGAYPTKGINATRAMAHAVCELEKLYEIYDERDELFAPHETCTFEPTKVLQNVSGVNTIPAENVLYYDCHLLPSVRPEAVIKSFKEISNRAAKKYGAHVTIEIDDLARSAPATPMSHPVVRSLFAAIKHINGIDARAIGDCGMTVAQNFRSAGFKAAVYSRIADVPHQPNEYCVIDYMVNDAKVWAYVFVDQ